MARPVYQYKPINSSEQPLGILLPLNKDAKGKAVSANYASNAGPGKGVFMSSYTTQEAVVSNLKNLILTQKGERYMQPSLGTSIKKVLFENNTSDMRDILQSTIEDDISKWLPYVKLTSLDIASSSDMYSIDIKLYFKITTIGANIVINILANENEFQVTDVTEAANLQLVGSFGADTAFNTGLGGSF
tara:strand:- start:253 stop:816 length:564 start_codon:yes stop_codon:yes gene_type:complete